MAYELDRNNCSLISQGGYNIMSNMLSYFRNLTPRLDPSRLLTLKPNRAMRGKIRYWPLAFAMAPIRYRLEAT